MARRDDPEYDGRWLRLRTFYRFFVIVRRFLPLVAAYARDRRKYLLFGGRRRVDAADRRRRAEFLLDTFVDLGPTFIKLGQLLSTRPDALPPEYVAVLSRLQDRVPPAPWPEAEAVIAEELGPVAEVYDEFDTDPISGASLGQVYTATCDGEKVAVKVLRPNIHRVVEADLRVIDALVPLLVRAAPPGQSFTLANLAEEFAATIREEMDYGHEARMLRTVKANFADDPGVVVPSVLDDRSTDRVITMEYVEGTKIDDVAALDRMGVDRTDLVRRLEEAYIQMIIEDGVFHADPHPGNLAVKPDGSIVFYDFGMVGRVDDRLQDRMLDFYVGVATDDIERIIDAFVAMGALDPSADRDLMREVFELVLADLRGQDVEVYRVEQLVGEFQETMYEFPLRLPRNLALVVRVSTVLDGVCRSLDPEFDFIEVVTEYVREEGYGDRGVEQLLERFAEMGRESLSAGVSTPRRVESVLDRVERGSLAVDAEVVDENDVFDRVAAIVVSGLLAGGTLLAAVVLWSADQVPAALVALAGTVASVLWFYRQSRTRRGQRVNLQFTRQGMKEQGVRGPEGEEAAVGSVGVGGEAGAAGGDGGGDGSDGTE